MEQYKHICELEYCKKHSQCVFKNATSLLKSDSYIVALGSEEYHDRILCYQKEDIGLAPLRSEDSLSTWAVTVSLRKKQKEEKEKGTYEKTNYKTGEVIRCSNIYCGTTDRITQHHLIPNPYRKGVVGGNRKIPLCWTCHSRVHNLKSNKQLALHFNTKQSVLGLLAEDISFRLSRMMTVIDVPALPKREMTIVSLNSVPSGLEMSEIGYGMAAAG